MPFSDIVATRGTERDESPSAQYAVEVRGGLYQGLQHRLGPGRHVMGSAADVDLRLLEASFSPNHVAFLLSGDTLRVEGLADGVSVDGAGPVPPGSARTVRLPAIVTVGGVRMAWGLEAPAALANPHPRRARSLASRITAARPKIPQPGGARHALAPLRDFLRRPAIPALAAAGILVVTMSLTVANPKPGRLAGGPAAPDAATVAGESVDPAPVLYKVSLGPTPETAKPVASVAFADPAAKLRLIGADAPAFAPAPSKASAERAAASLAEDVRRAGLLNVRVAAGNNAIVASGSVEPAMAARWSSLQQGFDERFGGGAPLVSSVSKRAEVVPGALGIQGVWRGKDPYIVIGGQRYRIGALVDGGWTIHEIEKDRVLLERDGRLVAMRY